MIRRVAPGAAVAGLVLGAASGATAAPAAWLTRRLVDELAAGGARAAQVGLLAASAALLAGAGRAAVYLGAIPDATVEARVRVETSRALALASGRPAGTAFLEDPAAQDRLLLATRGAHEAPVQLIDSVSTVLGAVTGIATFVVVLAASWPWMLAALFATAAPIALVQRRLSRQMFRTTERVVGSYRWSDYYAALFTAPAPAREMRLYGTQRLLADRMSGHLSTALHAEARQRRRNAAGQIGFALANGAVAAAGSVVVALAVLHSTVTVGGLVLFGAAVTAVQGYLTSLIVTAGQVSVNLRVFGGFLDFVAAAERAAPGGADRLPPLREACRLRGRLVPLRRRPAVGAARRQHRHPTRLRRRRRRRERLRQEHPGEAAVPLLRPDPRRDPLGRRRPARPARRRAAPAGGGGVPGLHVLRADRRGEHRPRRHRRPHDTGHRPVPAHRPATRAGVHDTVRNCPWGTTPCCPAPSSTTDRPDGVAALRRAVAAPRPRPGPCSGAGGTC